jgi:hypothetical protein
MNTKKNILLVCLVLSRFDSLFLVDQLTLLFSSFIWLNSATILQFHNPDKVVLCNYCGWVFPKVALVILNFDRDIFQCIGKHQECLEMIIVKQPCCSILLMLVVLLPHFTRQNHNKWTLHFCISVQLIVHNVWNCSPVQNIHTRLIIVSSTKQLSRAGQGIGLQAMPHMRYVFL